MSSKRKTKKPIHDKKNSRLVDTHTKKSPKRIARKVKSSSVGRRHSASFGGTHSVSASRGSTRKSPRRHRHTLVNLSPLRYERGVRTQSTDQRVIPSKKVKKRSPYTYIPASKGRSRSRLKSSITRSPGGTFRVTKSKR
jgi:hypothetical protein